MSPRGILSARGDSVIAFSTATIVFGLPRVDGSTVNGSGRRSAIKGAARYSTLPTPRPDRGFMAGTKRKRYMQADRGRGRDRGKEAVTVAVAVAEAETERKRGTSRRMNDGRAGGGRGRRERKGRRGVATAESRRAAGWRGDTKME